MHEKAAIVRKDLAPRTIGVLRRCGGETTIIAERMRNYFHWLSSASRLLSTYRGDVYIRLRWRFFPAC